MPRILFWHNTTYISKLIAPLLYACFGNYRYLTLCFSSYLQTNGEPILEIQIPTVGILAMVDKIVSLLILVVDGC